MLDAVAPCDDATARAGRRAVAALSAAFFLSGFAALLYQVVWQRMLGLFAGSDAVTASLVVGAFLLGLGIGSIVAGRFADRLSPQRAAAAFALCEVAIAAYAVASRVVLYDLVGSGLGPALDAPWKVFAACVAALLPPTVAMGMSLPILARAVVPRVALAARRIGWMYGLNTLGAALGALVTGLLLIGTLGLQATLWVGAGLNLLAAVLALGAASGLATPDWAPRRRMAAAPPLGWMLLVFASGFLIVAFELVWLRLLGMTGQGNAYAFALILAVFLAADGLGLLAGARLADRTDDPRGTFLRLQGWAAFCAVCGVLALWLLNHLPAYVAMMGVDATRFGKQHMLVLAIEAAIVVGPAAFLLGMSFPLVQKAVQRDAGAVGAQVGWLQFANIMGNAAGGLAGGLVMLHHLGTAGATLALGLLGLGLLLLGGRLWAPRQALPAAALAGVLVALPGNAAFWSRFHNLHPAQQAIHAEDRSGVVLLRLADGSGPMFIGGFTQSRVPFWPIHYFMGALGPALHPAPRDVLVIGVGSGGTPFAAGWHPGTLRLHAIELVAPVYEVLRTYAAQFPASAFARFLADPRVTFSVGDGRRALFAEDAQRWDVVQADAILPQSSHSGFLYSVEFLEQVRDSLAPGGLFVQWAPTARVAAGFTQVFPHVLLIGPASVLVGSSQPIAWDPARLRAAFEDPAFVARARAAGVDPGQFAAQFAGPVRRWIPGSPRPALPANTDLFPRDEFYLNNDIRAALDQDALRDDTPPAGRLTSP